MTQRAVCHIHTQHWDLNTTQFTWTVEEECRSVYFEKNLGIQTQLPRLLDQLCCIKEETSSFLLTTHISPSLCWEQNRYWWLSLHVLNNLIMNFISHLEYLWLGLAACWGLFLGVAGFEAWRPIITGYDSGLGSVSNLTSHLTPGVSLRSFWVTTVIVAISGTCPVLLDGPVCALSQPVFRAAARPDMCC